MAQEDVTNLQTVSEVSATLSGSLAAYLSYNSDRVKTAEERMVSSLSHVCIV